MNELTELEYLQTFSEPMHRLGADDDAPVRVELASYLDGAIRSLSLPTDVNAIALDRVYVGSDRLYTHVLFNWGAPNRFLVLVVDNRARAILGHRLLALA